MNDVMDMTVRDQRSAKEILDEATERATLLKEIVQQTKTFKKIGEKDHLQIEAWQTIGSFYGCTARSSVEPVEVHGVLGFKAHGIVVEDRSGRIMSEADAYCFEDEEQWQDKDQFALSSMAQTRSMSRALANKFRWVVVLAGYATTPVEEMDEKRMASQLKFRFGTHKGKSPHELSIKELCIEQADYQQRADDPTNKWRDDNKRMLEAIKAELVTRKPQENAKGDANLFEGYCSRMKAAKEAKVIREEQKLGAMDQRLSLDQQTAVNDLAVEMLAGLSQHKT